MKRRPGPFITRFAICTVFCTAGLLAPGAAGQAIPPPLVRTNVVFDSSLLKDNLDPAELARAQQELAAYAAEKLPNPGFDYMRWMPAQVQPELPSAAELRIVVHQISSSGIPRLVLEYQAFLGDEKVKLSSIVAQPIYDGPAPSVHSVGRLIADVKSLRLDKDLPNEDFRRRLGEEFVHNIPLSDKVIVESGKPDIILPLDFDALHASDHSLLYVAFNAQPDTQPAADGYMRLRPMKKVPLGTFQGGVNCRLYMFEFKDVSVPEDGVADPQVIPQVLVILAPPSIKRVHVYMDKFERQLGTLITTPEP